MGLDASVVERVDRQPEVVELLLPPVVEEEVSRHQRIGADVDASDLGQQLRPRSSAAAAAKPALPPTARTR